MFSLPSKTKNLVYYPVVLCYMSHGYRVIQHEVDQLSNGNTCAHIVLQLFFRFDTEEVTKQIVNLLFLILQISCNLCISLTGLFRLKAHVPFNELHVDLLGMPHSLDFIFLAEFVSCIIHVFIKTRFLIQVQKNSFTISFQYRRSAFNMITSKILLFVLDSI